MILTYSLDRFVLMIQNKSKIHTIRHDAKNRWKIGMSIQHWRGNPRNVAKMPYKFSDGECKGIQAIRIFRAEKVYFSELTVWIDNRKLSHEEVERLAANDGLSIAEFIRWFVPKAGSEFHGKIIHFTDLKY